MYMMNLMNMMTVVMRYVYRSYGYRSTGSGNYGTYLLMTLAVILIPLIAQINVKSTFSKYSQVRNLKGLTADQVARMILDSNGLYNVRVEHVSGKLTDLSDCFHASVINSIAFLLILLLEHSNHISSE